MVHQNADMEIASEQIPLFVTQKMVPKCRMLVFFVRRDGEFVSDSIVLPVEAKFENEVCFATLGHGCIVLVLYFSLHPKCHL